MRLAGLERVHVMADLLLYRDRCGGRAPEIAIIAAQFETLPIDLQQSALQHEASAVENVKDVTYNGVTSPRRWPWFCSRMDKDILKGVLEPIFQTAREGIFPEKGREVR